MSRHAQAAGPIGAAAALIVSIAACDAGTDRTVIAPTAPPTSSPPAPPAGTVTGMVLELTTTGERRPVPNLRLQVRTGGPADGAVGGVELPDVVTDRNGRYEIAGVTSPLLFFTTAPGSDHRFLCDFYPLVTRLRRCPGSRSTIFPSCTFPGRATACRPACGRWARRWTAQCRNASTRHFGPSRVRR